MTDVRVPSRTMRPKISTHCSAVFVFITLTPHRCGLFTPFFPPLSSSLLLLLGREKAISNILSRATATAFSHFLACGPWGLIFDWGKGVGWQRSHPSLRLCDAVSVPKTIWALGGLLAIPSSCFPFQSVHRQTHTDVDGGRADDGVEGVGGNLHKPDNSPLAVWC